MASSIPPHWYYTDAEIDAANDTDLPDLLAYLGYQVRRISSYYTTREMDSLRIRDRRTWYRYSESLAGTPSSSSGTSMICRSPKLSASF